MFSRNAYPPAIGMRLTQELLICLLITLLQSGCAMMANGDQQLNARARARLQTWRRF